MLSFIMELAHARPYRELDDSLSEPDDASYDRCAIYFQHVLALVIFA